MKHAFQIVLTGILVFLSQGVSRAGTPDRWELLLDHYESICRQCLALRNRQDSGESISGRQLLILLDELERLREEIKGVTDKMPLTARRRFDAIKRMYASGKYYNTQKLEAALIPVPPLSSIPSALPDIIHRRPEMPVLDNRRSPSWAVSASLLVPEYSYGAMIAFWGQYLGGYTAFRSNYSYHKTSYEALSDGSSGANRIWTSGAAAIDRFFVTAGPTLRLEDHWGLFGGLGYGFRRLCWEDSQGEWMHMADASPSGLCAEVGFSWFHHRYILSASWLSILPACHSASISIGYCF